ncbi:TIGR03560 family F420-dependent LLM class oxidoreductase [Cryobacterium sp. SO2]|uniref:TIGR03560 family F420-dependent LLM class oxidoreductase n=1 Tax=Cryobacterium sp. SO2 TaxID=1897060 RepID=UPI00223CBDB2|nr:TIGR03560 family F420-dependent LLM class oxidoreductase [Cryobacterium sp. SO2]WEO77302.1 TIGR03560 family F420-dependent LLM class oxidoreductase [Cryobacterium sp. SO2]
MDLRILIEPQEGAGFDDQRAAAVLAEELGFGGFFRTDHFLPLGLGGGEAMPETSDAWVSLAALARETSRIRLGTLVTAATFRLPGPLAVQVSQVDSLSGGRIELGLGAGWFEREHRAYGIPFPDVVTRFDRLEEQLEILSRFWRTPVGETFSFEGAHYRLEDCPALPRAVQTPPPIIVGGKGKPRGLRLAARWAAEFNLEFPRPGTPETVRGRLRETCAAEGRDLDTLVFSAAHLACVGRTRAELSDRAGRAGLDLGLDLGAIIGTVDEARSALARLGEQGITRFYLQLPDLRDLDHLRSLAELL